MAGDGIVLDYNNMLAPRLGGGHGIDPARLDAMAGAHTWSATSGPRSTPEARWSIHIHSGVTRKSRP